MLVEHNPTSIKLFGNQIKIVHGLMDAVLADDEAAEFIRDKLLELEEQGELGQSKTSIFMDLIVGAGNSKRSTSVLLSICSDILTIAISSLTVDHSLDTREINEASPLLSPFIKVLAENLDGYAGFKPPLERDQFRHFVTAFSQDESPFGMRCKGTLLSSLQILSIVDNLVPRYCAMTNYERVLSRLIGRILASGGLNSFERTRRRSLTKMISDARIRINAIHHIDIKVALPDSVFAKQVPTKNSEEKAEDLLAALKDLNRALRRLGLSNRNETNKKRNETDAKKSPTREAALSEAEKELSSLIGMEEVKEEIELISNYLKIQKIRKSKGLPVGDQTLHFVFTGNPGTGKTTAARLLGRILYGLGVLGRENFQEVDRSQLVAEYTGQTAIKTNKAIDKAMDGTLFIDEAYSLAPTKDRQNSYGREAISTILKRMEDDRDRLCIIVAGYPEPMDEFLSSNPGLRSRFTRTIHFPDYRPESLLKIFELFSDREEYKLSDGFRAKLASLFVYVCIHQDHEFGNARFARSLYEHVICRHSTRLAREGDFDHESLVLIKEADLQIDEITGYEVDWKSFDWRIRCPDCGQKYEGTWQHLWTEIQCQTCETKFAFETLKIDTETFEQLKKHPPELPF